MEITSGNLGGELAALPGPEQLQQRVIVARHQDGDALARPRRGQAPLHREAAGHLGLEGLAQLLERQVDVPGLELEPGEVDAAVVAGGVLVEVDDVGAVAEQEGGDGGDDAGLVGAADEEDGARFWHGPGRYQDPEPDQFTRAARPDAR